MLCFYREESAAKLTRANSKKPNEAADNGEKDNLLAKDATDNEAGKIIEKEKIESGNVN